MSEHQDHVIGIDFKYEFSETDLAGNNWYVTKLQVIKKVLKGLDEMYDHYKQFHEVK